MNETTERDLERLERILRDLALPSGQWVVSGSGILVLHGLDRHKPMGDVDIFVATRLWFKLAAQFEHVWDRPLTGHLPVWKVWTTDPDDPKRRCDPPYLYRDMYGIEVNVFSAWRRRGIGDLDVNWLIHNAQEVRGWPCYSLQVILDWKREVGREKDVYDIALLEEHLGEAAR